MTGFIHTQYVDNSVAIGREGRAAEEAAQAVSARLTEVGLPVDPVIAAPLVGVNERA